ncbi:12906_t:CDS:2, partial [Acaulospora colombiana]
FYKLLDQLNNEYDELLLGGHAGDGFYTNGIRLGSGVTHNVTPEMAKQRALEAAERRKRMQRIMTNGGVRLGGDGLVNYVPMRELAAMAAERRISDMVWCGSEERNGANHAGPSRSSSQPSQKPQRPVRIPDNKLPGVRQWSCPRCTFDNRPSVLQCEMCSFRPSDTPGTSSQPIVIDDSAKPTQPAVPSANNQNALDGGDGTHEMDLIVFDDDVVNNNNGGVVTETSNQPLSLIDTLLCDPNFGAHASPVSSPQGSSEPDGVLIPQNKRKNRGDDLRKTKSNEIRAEPLKENFRSKIRSKRRVYSFTELILYKSSPIAKEIKCAFSEEAAEYNLLVAEKSDGDRQLGTKRLTTHRNGNGDSKAYVAPALRKNDEPFSFSLSFINEFLEAQNRWVALMMRGSLVKKLQNQMIDCKVIENIVSIHYRSKDEHEERCSSRYIKKSDLSDQHI